MPATPNKNNKRLKKGSAKWLEHHYPDCDSKTKDEFANLPVGDPDWKDVKTPKVNSQSTMRARVGARFWHDKTQQTGSKCWTCFKGGKSMKDVKLTETKLNAELEPYEDPIPGILRCGHNVEKALFEECCVLVGIIDENGTKASEASGGKPLTAGKSCTLMFEIWKKSHCVDELEDDYKFDCEEFLEAMDSNGWGHSAL